MGKRVVYFHGVRLWETLKHWKPTLTRAGNSRKIGVSRRLGKLNARSPNFFYEIAVHTAVSPAVIGAGALADLGYQETFNLQMLQVQKDLVEQGNALGDLSWCQDDTEVLVVGTVGAMPGSYPGSASWTYTGAGWTPAVGDYALIRDPSSGEGFVTRLDVVGGGSITAIVKQEILSGWEIIRVRFFFPDTAFVAMAGWETAVQAEDRHAFDVTYAFESGAHPVYPAGYIQDIS